MWILLVGCLVGPRSCPSGYGITADGECVAVADDGPADLDPTCELAAPGDRLDLEAGCADGGCNDMPYADMVTALGDPSDCHVSGDNIFCDWQGEQIESFFDDEDEDGQPDPDAEAHGVFLSEGWPGTNPDGLGLEIAMSCFTQVFGEADQITYTDVDGEPVLSELHWSDEGLFVKDRDSDGLADKLSVFGFH